MAKSMFKVRHETTNRLHAAILGFEVIYHSIVRDVRNQHKNAFVALAINFMQAVTFISVFLIMFAVLGLRGSAVRGDFVVYIMTGVFLYLTHIRAVMGVAGASGSSSPLHQHAPMNTIVGIVSKALGALYMQLLVASIILGGYHIVWKPVELFDPLSSVAMLILAWFNGVSVGLILLALKPWVPGLIVTLRTFYIRANMIASGKMFLANTLPGFMLAMFDWNPLFHAIDQSRGYAFINYYPRNSSWEYAFWVGVTLTCLGLLGIFFGERSRSISWSANK